MKVKAKGSATATLRELRELLDISAFQYLTDSFTRLTGISTAILDLKGEILTASGWQEICSEFHRRNPAAASRCLESDTALAGMLARGEHYHVYKCRNGLVDVAVPITIGGMHMGNLFIGQFLFEAPDREFFARQADEFGFDKDPYLAALSEVPVFPEERIGHAIDFLRNLTVIIGNTGLDKKRLFEMNRTLEELIQERTAELTYSNERLRVLSEASFEGVIISENGVILEANTRMAKIGGFRKAMDLVGMKIANFIAPETRENVRRKIASGYEKPYEAIGLKRDGTMFPIEIYGKTFTYQGRKVRGTAIRDLTVERRAEKEIKALRGILPLCASCKKIRNDKGYWEQIESYIREHSEADFSHGICPECAEKLYPDYYKKK